MGVKEDFFRLKSRWVKARDEERIAVEKELDEFYAAIVTDEDKALLAEAVQEDFRWMLREAKEIKELAQNCALRKRMTEILPFISLAKFAKTYFGKSTSWLHQRINGNEVHGKRAALTAEEVGILANALREVAAKMNATADQLAAE